MKPGAGSKIKILVVDDNECIREVLTTLLSRRGHRCESATNGIEAIQKVKQGNFDAVITDLQMPEMDGIALTRELRQHFSDLPVMIMTGHSDEILKETAIRSGAMEFVSEPFRVSDSLTKLQRMFLTRKLA